MNLPPGLTLDLPPGLTLDAPESVGMDLVKSTPQFGVSALSSALGLPGDIVKGGRWLGEQIGLGDPSNNARIMGSSEVAEDIGKMTGPLHQPQYALSKGIDLGAKILPGMIGGPQTAVAKLATRVALPAAASTVAGKVTEGTEFQPAAEIAGLLLAPYAANKSVKVLTEYVRRGLVPTTEMLKGSRDALYKLADMSGTRVNAPVFRQAAQNWIAPIAQRYGNVDDLRAADAKVLSLIRLINNHATLGTSPKLSQLQNWRKEAGKILDSGDPTGFGAKLYGDINKFIGGLATNMMTGRNAQYAVNALRQADALHGRYKNSQIMDKFYAQAKNRLANYREAGEATGLRQKFRALADKLADEESRESRFFSPEMKSAIEKVARGDFTRNALRAIGSFVPWGLKGGATYLGPTATAAFLGFDAFLSGLISAGAGALTTGAKIGEGLLTKRAANQAADLIRLGRPLPNVPQASYPWLLPPIVAGQKLNE